MISEHPNRSAPTCNHKAFALFAVYMIVLNIALAGVFVYAVLQL